MRQSLYLGIIMICSLWVGMASAQDKNVALMLSTDGWEFSEAGKNNWKPAKVPGTIYGDLYTNKLIQDPRLESNYKLCQWVETTDWEYRYHLKISVLLQRVQNIELRFDGLDTFADVYLNDSLILRSDNMFRSYIVPIKKYLLETDNLLRIRFHSPVAYARQKNAGTGLRYPADNDSMSPFIRKAALHFGWDFAPRMAGCGIWKNVSICLWNDCVIRDVQVRQRKLSADTAYMTAEVKIESAGNDSVTLVSNYFHAFNRKVVKGLNVVKTDFRIIHPRLWWPEGMGEQNLYTLNTKIAGRYWGDTKFQSGARETRFGLRTFSMINQEDSLGQNFYAVINGRPFFAKGASVVPHFCLENGAGSDSLYTLRLFKTMQEEHFNMVRVWGGGVYGDEKFYRMADEAGILVWQDFMFSGTMYPGDKAFLQNVEKEAEDNILSIRNHPSLALWCGNNEIAVAWENWGWQKQWRYSKEDSLKLIGDYRKLFEDLLPGKVKELDSSRFYFASTPISNWGKKRDFSFGDNHYWGVWHGEEKLEAYQTHIPRFMSEFGFQSFPGWASLKEFSAEKDWSVSSDVMKAHQFSYKGNGLIEKYMGRDFHKPKDFASFIYLSQVLQAKGMQLGIEAQRRAIPYCMGSLYWQLNDYWPTASWSVLDYYGRTKLAHESIRKAFQPLVLSSVLQDNRLRVYCISEGGIDRELKLCLRVSYLNGNPKFEICQPVKISGNSSKKLIDRLVRSKDRKNHGITDKLDLKNIYLRTLLIDGKDTLAAAPGYFVPGKELALTKPTVTWELTEEKETKRVKMKLQTDVLAKDVVILKGEEYLKASDNYFDLVPGEVKVIYLEEGESPEILSKAIRILSLWDSY